MSISAANRGAGPKMTSPIDSLTPICRATGKSRLHGKHGNCVFERMPCFLPVSVKCRVFGHFDVFSVVN
jgi:hypothetical protein